MITDHISSALRRGLIGFLLLLAGVSLTGSPAAAYNAYEPHHRDHGHRERNYQAPSYQERYHQEHHHNFERHHHERCRTRLVPYWDPYWGVWSQRVERDCW